MVSREFSSELPGSQCKRENESVMWIFHFREKEAIQLFRNRKYFPVFGVGDISHQNLFHGVLELRWKLKCGWASRFEYTSIPLLGKALHAWPPAIRHPGQAVPGLSTRLLLCDWYCVAVFCDPLVMPIILHVGSLDDQVVLK